MRKIKFRGKRIGNIWVYGDLVHLEKGCIIITSSNLTLDDSLSENNALVYSEKEFSVVIPETVGQFTGLTDNNDKKIYEGDICNCSYGYTNDKIGIVYYEDGCFYVDDKHPSSNMPLKSLVKNEANRIEIIGNIYDTPELLTKQ